MIFATGDQERCGLLKGCWRVLFPRRVEERRERKTKKWASLNHSIAHNTIVTNLMDMIRWWWWWQQQ